MFSRSCLMPVPFGGGPFLSITFLKMISFVEFSFIQTKRTMQLRYYTFNGPYSKTFTLIETIKLDNSIFVHSKSKISVASLLLHLVLLASLVKLIHSFSISFDFDLNRFDRLLIPHLYLLFLRIHLELKTLVQNTIFNALT